MFMYMCIYMCVYTYMYMYKNLFIPMCMSVLRVEAYISLCTHVGPAYSHIHTFDPVQYALCVHIHMPLLVIYPLYISHCIVTDAL